MKCKYRPIVDRYGFPSLKSELTVLNYNPDFMGYFPKIAKSILDSFTDGINGKISDVIIEIDSDFWLNRVIDSEYFTFEISFSINKPSYRFVISCGQLTYDDLIRIETDFANIEFNNNNENKILEFISKVSNILNIDVKLYELFNTVNGVITDNDLLKIDNKSDIVLNTDFNKYAEFYSFVGFSGFNFRKPAHYKTYSLDLPDNDKCKFKTIEELHKAILEHNSCIEKVVIPIERNNEFIKVNKLNDLYHCTLFIKCE